MTTSPSSAASVPAEIRGERRWVCWRAETRNGRRTKVPFRADDPSEKASSTDPETWASFDDALATAAVGEADGVGFVLGDGWIGFDLDRVLAADGRSLAPGFPLADAFTWIASFNSYCERSPSATGLHIIGRGALPEWAGNRKGPIEVYDAGRYFTVTGDVFEGLATPRTLEADLLAAFLEAAGLRQAEQVHNGSSPTRTAFLDDHELLKRAFGARNGAELEHLWRGEWEGRYGSRSEADLALVGGLAFWTGPDEARLDALFRQSGLMRPHRSDELELRR
jgi:putative DNA primase/helicase